MGLIPSPKAVALLAADLTDDEARNFVPEDRGLLNLLTLSFVDDHLPALKRAVAVHMIYAELLNDNLDAVVRCPPGHEMRLTGDDWRGASLWPHIIKDGVVAALPGTMTMRPDEPLVKHSGEPVLFDADKFEAFRLKRATQVEAWGPLHEAGKKVLALLAKLEAEGRQIDNLDKKGERKLRHKLVADTDVPYSTAVRLLTQFREGRRD
jgi:hypothetical protein